MAIVALREEVTELLQGLLRIDTVNPPGNETLAAEYLREYLGDHGVAADVYARVPERANLVARIPGRRGGPRLLLLSHTDTVLADPAEWQVDPWSGELRGGAVWGRGALDMKGQVAASAVAIASLAREGFEPEGDLIFAATADEEVGEDFGVSWLCAEHPDTLRCEYCVNEGAGDRLELGGRVFYVFSAAEKMSSPFLLRVHGRSGHASMPGIADNALVTAARLIQRLADYRPELELGPETGALVEAVTGRTPTDAESALADVRALDPLLADLLQPLLSLTLSPTMVTASHQRNVIPARCDVTVDCRLLPGRTQDEARRTIGEVLGPGDWELMWQEGQGGTRSPLGTPLADAVASFVEGLEPGALAVPVCVAGFTDSHWIREAYGAVAYGFFPARAMDAETASRLVHSADERIPVDDLELGVDWLRHAAQAVCGSPDRT